MHISEVAKFLAETPNETTHSIELINPLDTTNPLIIPLKLSSVTRYFDVFPPSIAELEDENFPQIYLTAEEPHWAPSTSKYSEQETQMLDH